MSASLTQAIDDMRDMRESYDQLAGAAAAYNEGKPALATAITAKGVATAASDSLATMADNVAAIQQETYEIDGGEMYEKQLYAGATTVVNDNGVYKQTGGSLWNLYEVMAQLLSDGRFVGYGGILIAEYFKGYETIELMNAGAGGAYFTCDGDFYTTDRSGANAHIWHDYDNGMMNRWVAYLFASEGTNYSIPSTNLCPRSIHIGRTVGTIVCAYEGRISEIVVTDGNHLGGLDFSSTQVWQQKVIIKNLGKLTPGVLRNSSTVTSLYVQANTVESEGYLNRILINNYDTLNAVYLDVEYVRASCIADLNSLSDVYFNKNTIVDFQGRSEACLIAKTTVITPKSIINLLGLKSIYAPSSHYNWIFGFGGINDYNMKKWNIPDLQESDCAIVMCYMQGSGTPFNSFNVLEEINLSSLKKLTTSFRLAGGGGSEGIVFPALKDLIVGPMETNLDLGGVVWNPVTVLATPEGVAEINANIRNHIAANVADGNNTLTFTVSTNLYNNLEQATLDAFEAKHWLVAGA